MNEFEKITESETRRNRANSREGREANAENKENQAEAAEKKMAARERVEQTSKEIKNTKNQIQNIIANMQSVVKAVAAIRAQLQIAQNDNDIPSVARDQKTLDALHKKLDGLFSEIKDLRGALIAEEQKSVQEDMPDASADTIVAEATRRANNILRELGIEDTKA